MGRLVERVRARLGGLGRGRLLGLVAGGALVGLLVLVGVAYAVDQSSHAGRVERGVQVGGRDASGRSKAQLARMLAEVDQRYATTAVEVDLEGGGAFATDAGTIGLRIDPDATARDVMKVGRTGSLPGRVWSWLGSFTSTRTSPLALSVDRAAVAKVVAEQTKGDGTPTVEASIAVKKGVFVGVAGKAGDGVDADLIADALPAAARRGTPIVVHAKKGRVEPRFTKDDADALAKKAEQLVSSGLPLATDGATGQLSPAQLRGLISSVPGEKALELKVDEQAAGDAATKALAGAGTPAKEPTFTIAPDGTPQLVPGAPGRTCCQPDAGTVVAQAILNRPAGAVQLAMVDRQPKTTNEQAAAFGIKEKVSTFTTRHPCCQNRVTNIHRIADLVRGQVIPPGATFSVNAFVGQRTTDKGFLVDHVIEDGKFGEDVGGGISQFATTFFNASWFAGLGFGEYQSHSLYISRYPYGRDATLGFPHPDLQIKNTSPYGVLIWPTYTGTSLTVDLYSTKWVQSVVMTGQDKQARGSCTLVTSNRQITFLDGKQQNDSTRAVYRANEGQNCTDAQPPPSTTSTATTKPGTKPPAPTTTVAPPPATTATTKKPAVTTTVKR